MEERQRDIKQHIGRVTEEQREREIEEQRHKYEIKDSTFHLLEKCLHQEGRETEMKRDRVTQTPKKRYNLALKGQRDKDSQRHQYGQRH